MTISSKYSINRIKKLMKATEGKSSKRAARVYIACRMWLGTW